MDNLGFTKYDPAPEKPSGTTPKERLDALGKVDQDFLLDSFAKEEKPNRLKHKCAIHGEAIKYYYANIKRVKDIVPKLMRGEKPPITLNELRQQVSDQIKEDLTGQQINDIIDRIIKDSKYDLTGDWVFFSEKLKPEP